MSEITISIEGGTDLAQKIQDLRYNIVKRMKEEVNAVATKMQTHIRQDLFRVYQPNLRSAALLAYRSGDLAKSVRVDPAQKTDDDNIRGGLTIGTRYAQVHFGKRGQSTHITPTTAKMLAIPLPAALDPRGIAKGKPRDKGIWGETFVKKNDQGNLIIYGKTVLQRGKNAGKLKNKIVPLFMLRRSVDVKARIIDEDLLKWAQPILGKSLEGLKNEIESAHAAYLGMGQ